MEMKLHGPGRNAERLCNFGDRQLVDVKQRNRQSLLARQRCQMCAELIELWLSDHAFRLSTNAIDKLLLAPATAVLVTQLVDRHSANPADRVVIVRHDTPLQVGLDKGFLHCVGCCFSASADDCQGAHKAPVVGAEQTIEIQCLRKFVHDGKSVAESRGVGHVRDTPALRKRFGQSSFPCSRRDVLGRVGRSVAIRVRPMPSRFASDDNADLLQAEVDVRTALGSLDLDLGALQAVSNIFRAATAVRNHMESSVLGTEQLSWSAFVVLFVLRVWGTQESSHLAHEAGVTGGTLTGVLKTLERRGLTSRAAHPTDKRRVMVSLTPAGKRAINRTMPRFNEHEAMVTDDLTVAERTELARLLRKVLGRIDVLDSV
jgi:MarR family transcriptional regulator, organic hydroperoxide resistance regulator